MNFTIGVKLTASFFAIFLLTAVFGIYSLVTTQRALQEAVGQASIFLARDQIERIDKDIFLKIEHIQLYSRDALLQKTLLESNQAFEELGSEYISQKDSDWVSAPEDVITPFMQELIENEVSDDLREQFIAFLERKYGSRVYGEAFVTNKYGANIAQTGKTSDYYQADEKWWQAAKDKGFFVGEVEYDESAGVWTMPFGVRIDDNEGNFLGVIKAIPHVQEIISEIELTTRKYQTTQLKLLTSNGQLIYSSKAFNVLDDVSGENFFKQIGVSNEGFFISQRNERDVLFAYARSDGFKDFAGLNWVLLIGHDTSEVFSTVYKLRNAAIGVFVLLFVIVGFLTFILSYIFSNPIRKLTKGAEYISRGNLDIRIEPKSTDEIGQLARAFNQMASRLKGSYENLEAEVERRTFELQNRVQELDKTAKMLVRRDLELNQTREQLQNRLSELNIIAKRLVRRDFELFEANETLRKIDEAKSRFVSIAAHQLRTPISAIKWTIHMAMDNDFGKIPKTAKDALGIAAVSIERLVELIGRLLNVASIEEGRFVYNFSEIQIEDVCKNVFKESTNIAKRLGISLKVFLPQNPLPLVYADFDNLIIVVQNLVDNALRYTQKRGSVEIIVVSDSQTQGLAKISIKDNGMGIPKYQRGLVGQKFFRGDNVVRKQISGTGLGLYIISKILEKHGTKLEFESEEGKGSTFFFTLPFIKK
jgi:signal transduction histidine kinase